MAVVEQTAFALSYVKVEENPFVSAVLVAAGNASRMGGSKQFIPLCGIPVLARSMLAFEHAPQIQEIIVAARPEDITQVQILADKYHIEKLKAIVEGGGIRQESVAAGVKACDPQTKYVAIHDGARPLVTQEVITHAIQGAVRHQAAAAGVFVKDTIKKVDKEGKVLLTPDRSCLVRVQTPQVFAIERYREALQQAQEQGWMVTDDCALCERAGMDVYITPGDYANIKITTMEDVAVAQSLLQEKGEPNA